MTDEELRERTLARVRVECYPGVALGDTPTDDELAATAVFRRVRAEILLATTGATGVWDALGAKPDGPPSA
jgi:hypothetical protein